MSDNTSFNEALRRSKLQTHILDAIDSKNYSYSHEIANALGEPLESIIKELVALRDVSIVQFNYEKGCWERHPDDLSMKIPYKQSWLVQEALEKAYQLEYLRCQEEGLRRNTFPVENEYLRKLSTARDIIATHIQHVEEMGG